MNTTYLLLGSNIGESEAHLRLAQQHIEKALGKITATSSLYRTAAWGKTDQPDFLNQIIIVHTKAAAESALAIVLNIEKEMGRVRISKNAPRVIDIDILFFNREIIRTKDLTVPHPEIQNRRFVLTPLDELSPAFIHPVLKKTVAALLKECPDELNVQKI